MRGFMYLLSRSDTLHDFVGPRSMLSKGDVLKILDQDRAFQLSSTVIKHLMKELVDHRDLYAILEKNVVPLVNIKLPDNYSPKIIKRIAGVSIFEPRVVLFFELLDKHLKTESTKINIGKYLSFDYMPGYNFITKRYSNYDNTLSDDVVRDAFKRANIAYLNLGCTAKTNKKTNVLERSDSGLYMLTNAKVRYSLIESHINDFFQCDHCKHVYLIVDTSSISLEDMGISKTTRIKLICSLASDWDAAIKYLSCGQNNLSPIQDNPDNVLEKALYGLDDIILTPPTKMRGPNLAIIKWQENTLEKRINDATVEVTPLSECIYNAIEKPKQATSAKCYDGKFAANKKNFFDIKRSGDYYQAIITKRLQINDPDNKYIFVTIDHLAFLKARLNGIPTIFTSIDSNTRNRMMYLYKNNVDHSLIYNQLKVANANIMGVLNNIYQYLVAERAGNLHIHPRIFDMLADVHNVLGIDEDTPLAKIIKNCHFQDKTKTLEWCRAFYVKRLHETFEFDEFFKSRAPPMTDLHDTIVQHFKTNVYKATKLCQSNAVSSRLLKNVESCLHWLPNKISRIINQVLYIEIIYCIKRLYLDISNVKEDVMHIQSLNMQYESYKYMIEKYGTSYLKDNIEEFNALLLEMNKVISNFSYLRDPTVVSVLGIEVGDYVVIMKRINDIINDGLYGKSKNNVSLVDMINNFDTMYSTKRQRTAAASAISNRLSLSILNKTINTLYSFACVKLNSLQLHNDEHKLDIDTELAHLKAAIQNGGGSSSSSKSHKSSTRIKRSRERYEEDGTLEYFINLHKIVNDVDHIDDIDCPYDYGFLLHKFQHSIIAKLPNEYVSYIEKIIQKDHHSSAQRKKQRKSANSDQLMIHDDYLFDIEIRVHDQLEKCIRNFKHLYIGYAAFLHDNHYSHDQSKSYFFTKLMNDELFMYMVLKDNNFLFNINMKALGIKESPDINLSSKHKFTMGLLAPKIYSYKKRAAEVASKRTQYLKSKQSSKSPRHKHTATHMSMHRGGTQLAFRNLKLADYYYKYYKPYYDLYHKK